MIGRLLLCLVLVCLVSNYSECGRFGGGRSSGRSSFGRSGGRSGGWSWSWGGSKPKSSSSSSHSYPSSSSGLSGSSGYSSHSYPSSSSGLSGSGGYNSHSYPSSSSGLSGSSGYNSHSYPSSNGLSGSSGYNSHSYPSSWSGLSGSSSKNSYSYPSSSSGGSSSRGSNGRTNKYPPSNRHSDVGKSPTYTNNYNSGYSGSVHQNPSQKHYYNTNGNPVSGTHSYNTPHFYSYSAAPQHVYITEYRNSDSRFSNLLTGLTLYNLGRAESHHHHYYHDDYYTHRYGSSGNSYSTHEKPKDTAICTLKVKEDNKLETLKIPCEIVSTFTEGSKVLSRNKEIETVCETNYTVINNTIPTDKPEKLEITDKPEKLLTKNKTSSLNITEVNQFKYPPDKEANDSLVNASIYGGDVNVIPLNITNFLRTEPVTASNASTPATESVLSTIKSENITASVPIKLDDEKAKNSSTPKQDVVSTTPSAPVSAVTITSIPNSKFSSITMKNSTKCITNTSTVDPLKVKGPPVNTTNMECEVEIVTKESRLVTKVNCQKLIEYSKKPEPPKKESAILPPKSTLKSWLSNPPWWMSIFIAV